MDNNTLKEIFQNDLNAIYSTERAILKELDVMASEVKSPQLRESFQMHKQQTEQQIRRIETVISGLGAKPKEMPVPAFKGLVEEKRQMMGMAPGGESIDVINIAAGSKTEHMEIACYEGLLDMAKKLGMEQIAAPLRENLQEEQATLQKLKTFSGQGTGQVSGGQRVMGSSQQRNQ